MKKVIIAMSIIALAMVAITFQNEGTVSQQPVYEHVQEQEVSTDFDSPVIHSVASQTEEAIVG